MTLEKLIKELQALAKTVDPQTLVLMTKDEEGNGLNDIDTAELTTVIQEGWRWKFYEENDDAGRLAVILWAI